MYDAFPNIPFIMKQEVLDIVTGVDNENNLVRIFLLNRIIQTHLIQQQQSNIQFQIHQ